MLSQVRRRIIPLCLLPTIHNLIGKTVFIMDKRSHLNIRVFGERGVV